MEQVKLELRSVTKHYGDMTALDGLSYTFTPGIYGILGANGAGKSTMMNLITDNLRRDSGSILWCDREILELGADFRRTLGYMPQQQGFYEKMTAGSFLAYMAELKGVPKRQLRGEISRLLEATGLTDVQHKKLGEFSGGMRQRALLAQALLGDPKVLILDEPTAGLDPRERIRIRNFISSLSHERIILLATHIVSDIESTADHILLMKHGRLERSGSCDELLESVHGKVMEIECPPEKLAEIQKKYHVAGVFRRGGADWVRIVGDGLPEGGEQVKDHRLTLEDVYLYYLGE